MRALARPPPAGLLDQARELRARVVVAAAAGEAVGQRQARAPRAAARGATAFSSTGTARSSRPRRAQISRHLGGARDRQLGVVAVVAALGEDARERLPGLGLAVEAGQRRAQAIGARQFAERALEAGDRAMALAGRDVGGGQARRRPRCARRRPSVIVRRRSAIRRRRRRSPAASASRPSASSASVAGIEPGGVLPGGHRPAGVAERALDQARRSAHSAAEAAGSASLLQDPRLVLEDVRQLRLAALADAGPPSACRSVGACPGRSRRLARRTSGALLRCSSSAAQADDLEPQRQAPLADRRCAASSATRSATRVGEAAFALVEARQRLARGRRPRAPARAARRQIRIAPARSSSALSVSSAARRSQPQRRSSDERGSRRAVEQQRRRRANPFGRRPTATCSRTDFVDGVGGGVGGAEPARRARAARDHDWRRDRARRPSRSIASGSSASGPAATSAASRRVSRLSGCSAARLQQRLERAGDRAGARCSSARRSSVGTWRGSARERRPRARASAASTSWQ